MAKIFYSLRRLYGENMTLDDDGGGGRFPLLKIGFTPEKKYILDDLIEEFILKVSERIKRGNNFKGSLSEVQEMVIDEYEKKIESDFGELI